MGSKDLQPYQHDDAQKYLQYLVGDLIKNGFGYRPWFAFTEPSFVDHSISRLQMMWALRKFSQYVGYPGEAARPLFENLGLDPIPSEWKRQHPKGQVPARNFEGNRKHLESIGSLPFSIPAREGMVVPGLLTDLLYANTQWCIQFPLVVVKDDEIEDYIKNGFRVSGPLFPGGNNPYVKMFGDDNFQKCAAEASTLNMCLQGYTINCLDPNSRWVKLEGYYYDPVASGQVDKAQEKKWPILENPLQSSLDFIRAYAPDRFERVAKAVKEEPIKNRSW